MAEFKQYFKPLELHFGSKWWIVSKKLHIPPEGYLVTSVSFSFVLYTQSITHKCSPFLLVYSYIVSFLALQNKGNICLGILEGSHIDDTSTVILGGMFQSSVCF